MQNFRSDVPVTVTPALILSNGEVSLDPVTLEPHSATTVDITGFLKAHGLSDTRGTAVMRYTFSPYEAVSGVVLSSDEVHRLYVNSYAQSPEEYWQGNSYDAALWAPDGGTRGSISIINTSQEQRTVHLTFLVQGHSEVQPPIIIPGRHTQTLNIDDLVSRSRETGAGIHVEYSEYPGDILVEGHLINKATGFEKYVHFLDKTLHYPNGTVRSQFLLLGQQPAEDGFPAGMSFRSVAVLRNIDSIPVQVTPTLKYERNGSPRSIGLKQLTLGVGESRIIDLSAEQKAGGVPSDFHQGSLTLDPKSDHASIVAELFNFNEQTGGFTIGPMFFAYPGRATQSIWRTDGTFQTTIMMENTAAQDDAVTVQLFSDNGTYSKTFPIAAGNLLKINLKQLQQENVPDDNGHALADTYGVLSVAGKNGPNSKLSFDKLIHSAVDSDYVGLPEGPGSCVSVQSVSLFLAGSQSPYQVWVETDWSDGSYYDSPANGTTSGNTSMLQITSTSNGDLANIYPHGQGGIVAFFGNPTPVMDCPACSVDDETPEGEATAPPMPTLSCSPAMITRAQSATCTVSASGSATYSGWSFTDGTNNVSSSNTSSSWSGTIVTGGTVKVNVSVQGSVAVPLSASLTVTPRTGFAFSAASPQQEPDPFSGNTCSISVPSPPTSSGDAVGMFCLAEVFTVQTSPQISSGPNTGYSYVTSVSNSDSNGPTAYYWIISPDLQNTASAFYQAQCGNYNAQTNPNGFISGANLNTDTIRHESGTVASHYENYVIAQNIPANNVGTVGESIVGFTDPKALLVNVSNTLKSKQDAITTATQVEPCDVTHNASCVFQGS